MAKRHLKRIVCGALLLAGGFCAFSVPAGIRVETESGADRTVQIAADEFRKFYREMTGNEAAGDKRLKLAVDAKISPDGNDAYRIVSDAAGATIVGDKPRSVLYGVYDLLGRRGGCRWYWDGDIVPKRAELDLAGLDVREHSRFRYRATRYFAHRGLSRFRAQQWGPEEWRREIDYLAKIRVNVFMLRMGWWDLFQKAFPDMCEYPDPSENLPGTGKGYDNHTLHWSLQFRGLLRKMIQDYGFERGMEQPEDFGTMTHWYTPTPKDFLDRMKPEFLPNSVAWYSDPSSLVWDIRDPKWMDMYWRLTEASIRHYGRSDILHTMGLSERKCSTNAAENLRLKIEVTKRLIDDAQRRHPESQIILGGWDFHFTWEPEECRQLFAALKDYKNLILWDYSVDEAREGGVVNSRLDVSKPSNWDVIGKFPYTFGVFQHATSCNDIRADYPRIQAEWEKCKDDPFCQGYIWWPETEHVDALWYEYFSKNLWNPRYCVEDLYAGFCRDRYGKEAAKLESVWRKVVPISIGHGCGHLSMNVLPFAPNVIDREKCFRTVPWRRCLNDAPAVFRGLAEVAWRDEKVKRDTIDLAATTTDRLLYAVISKVRVSLKAWREGAENASELKKYLRALAALTDAFAETLALSDDYSLWASFVKMDKIEKIRNPNFPQILLENAINDYCLGYQYEAAQHWYRPVAHDLERGIGALLDAGDRQAPAEIAKTDYRRWMLGTPLREMAPTSPRTEAAYRQTMLRLAEAAEIVCPHQPDADETIHFDGADEFFN